MNLSIPELTTDVASKTRQIFDGLKPKALMEKLLNMGYQTIILNGAFLDRFDGGIFLFIDDDVESLIVDYFYLEKLIETQENYEHGTYLNDGLFSLNAKSDRKIVKLEFQYCPGLDIKNLVTYAQDVTEDEYVGWWRSIASEIVNLASS